MRESSGGHAGVYDAFDTLRLPRRPFLDEAEIRAAFQRRAAEVHPDVAGGGEADFAALTRAYETLRKPALRLRHLLDLVGVESTSSAIPAELVELFPRIAQALQRIDAFLSRRNLAEGSVARALFSRELGEVRLEAAKVGMMLAPEHARAVADLESADAAWPDVSALAALLRRFVFLGKWQSQIQEAMLRLEIE